jgi:rhodanese-related sulfurtransferase
MSKYTTIAIAVSVLGLSAACVNEGTSMVKTITVGELNEVVSERPDALVIDVRSHAEYERVHAEPVKQVIVHTEMKESLHLLPDDKTTPIYLICRSGNRSGTAGRVLVNQGYENVYNVLGGTNDWMKMGFSVDSGRGVLDGGT